MRKFEVLIIGGGVAGTTAAETYRAGGGRGTVAIVSDEPHPLYSRVLLPHAIKGKIPPEKVFLKNADFYREKNIEFLAGRTVERIDFHHQTATLDGSEDVGFEKLVIAVGGKLRRWDAPGADLPGVLRMQTYDNARAIHDWLVPGSRLVIVGSGFIALEFAALAVEKKIGAILLNRGPRFWTSVLGEAMAAAIEAVLNGHGVEVRDHEKVSEVIGDGRVEGVKISTGETISCSAVGVGIGLEVPADPFGDLRGDHGIKADAHLETVHENVWTAGDCAEFDDEVIGMRHLVGNWTNAVAQGRHVGKALLGTREKFKVLTQYTSNVVSGANLIFLGETRQYPGMERVEQAIEPGKKIAEYHLLNGRTIGAILLNAPELRAEAVGRIMRG